MKIYGLTGSIATGKSTVAALLHREGIPIIDADIVSREVVAVGQPALAEIEAAFGPGVIQGDGTLNRPALGALIFGNDEKRKALNAIMHPRVQGAMAEKVVALAQAGHKLALMDIPLLFEARNPDDFEGIVVVYTRPDLQLKRLMDRNQLSEDEAKARIASQRSIDEKYKRATWVIDNSEDKAFTAEQVRLLAAHLKSISEAGD